MGAAEMGWAALLLLLCLTRASLQGGLKPQVPGALGRLYLPSLLRGKVPVYAPYGLQPGPVVQNGFSIGLGVPAKLGKAGFGAYAQVVKQKPGPGAGPGLGGYPGGVIQPGYPAAGGGFPVNGERQPAYANGYGGGGAGGNGYPGPGPQPGYSNGAPGPFGGRVGGPGAEPSAAKYGLGQGPYMVVPVGLGADFNAGKLANGNGLGYLNGGDLQANGMAPGAYGPISVGPALGGYGPVPAALAPGAYGQDGGVTGAFPLIGGKEFKYGLNGFLGNGYRARCPAGKC
ncbi:glycine-rich extracellular protein 1 isoform X3 [Alligator mississippiensis]|uniref:glycine-rich extracellular protein 1 isoform X3 n=1 Tax=Alligator mississippiensis TaxID=8496 RepID=UPI002877A86E|nr:glycine-rich extracellular protein 1 isoform X3 [Alligator mississippiensis]